jgi:hypothetical protein
MTNWPILSAGLLASATALVHIFLGGKDVARPLLRSSVDEVVKLTLYACWHLVSVALVLSSLVLLVNGFGFYLSAGMVAFVSALWIIFGGVFLVVTLCVAQPRGIFRFPQWALLVPVGLLGLWGLA